MKAAKLSRRIAEPVYVDDGPSARLSLILSVFSLIASLLTIIVVLSIDVSTPVDIKRSIPETYEFEPETHPNSRIWVFGYPPDYKPYSFLDKGALRGLSIRVIDAVCQLAKKNCRHMLVNSQFCYDPETEHGRAILDNWVDACVGYFKSVERTNSLVGFAPLYNRVTSRFLDLTKSFTIKELFNSTIKVGMLAGFFAGESCLHPGGVNLDVVHKFESVDSAVQGLRDRSINALLLSRYDEEASPHFDNVSDAKHVNAFHCSISGAGLLAKKGSPVLDWFPVALEQIKEAGKFESLCRKAETEYGENPSCYLNRL